MMTIMNVVKLTYEHTGKKSQNQYSMFFLTKQVCAFLASNTSV